MPTFKVAYGIYTIGKAKSLKLLARVAAGFGQLGHDIVKRR
jgi:hypothetical protein